jgi:hypothetical protein
MQPEAMFLDGSSGINAVLTAGFALKEVKDYND